VLRTLTGFQSIRHRAFTAVHSNLQDSNILIFPKSAEPRVPGSAYFYQARNQTESLVQTGSPHSNLQDSNILIFQRPANQAGPLFFATAIVCPDGQGTNCNFASAGKRGGQLCPDYPITGALLHFKSARAEE